MTLDTLQSHGISVAETMTTPSKPGKKPRPVWVVTGNTFGLESFFYGIGGKKYRGSWSFFEDPTEAIAEEITQNGRQSYAEQVEGRIERKAARIERYEGYSENASERSSSAFKKVDSIMSFIPPGQPILVGHHSERRHRRDLERMDSGMRKGAEEAKKADYYSHKASGLSYDIEKMTKSRRYIGNRIKEAEKEVASLERKKGYSSDPTYHERLAVFINQAKEKLKFWQGKMSELDAEGGRIATPENLRVGSRVRHRGISWHPVVRVNKKTVTIGNWLNIEKLTYKVPYSEITDFQDPQN